MITKAIVEELINPYQVRVRVPRLDGVLESPVHTAKEDLTIATICTLPNCYLNVQVGDIVFVAYEDNTERKLVILGHLSREASQSTTASDVLFNRLEVRDEFRCTDKCTIGEDITYTELKTLSGVKDNLQKQIDLLEQKIEQLFTLIDNIK